MLQLDKEELLVLFEFCHRICETSVVGASHHAEIAVIDKIAGDLERALAEPFSRDYPSILERARAQVLSRYRDRMGSQNWIEEIPLTQI